MDKQKASLLADELINSGEFELSFPPGLNVVWASQTLFLSAKKTDRILKVKEWLSKNKISIEFMPSPRITSRYAQQPVNPKFYGIIGAGGIK